MIFLKPSIYDSFTKIKAVLKRKIVISFISINNYTLSVNVFYFNFTTNILNVNKYGQKIELK